MFRILLSIFIFVVGLFVVVFLYKELSESSFGDGVHIDASDIVSNGGLFDLFIGKVKFVQQKCCSDSVVAGNLEDGSSALFFKVSPIDEKIKGNFRSEWRYASAKYDEPIGFDASVYIPGDWVTDPLPVIVMQWHGARDRFLGEKGRFPPLEIAVEGNEWVIRSASDDRLVTPSGKSGILRQIEIGRAPLEKGRLSNWSVDVLWTWRDNGRVLVKLDGAVVADYHGRTAYKDLIAPYFKMGVYSPRWKHHSASSNAPKIVGFTYADIREGRFN